MSRTFKDKREEKAKRRNREPGFLKRYRDVLERGFPSDFECDFCPDCGAHMRFDQGYFCCEECNLGSFFPEEKGPERELEFNHVA